MKNFTIRRVARRRSHAFRLLFLSAAVIAATGCESEFERGRRAGHASGRAEGFRSGHTSGYSDGVTDGERAGREKGRKEGYREGYSAGVKDGEQAGHKKGHEEGYNQGQRDGFNSGHEQGTRAGHEEGLRAGYNSGYTDGSEGKPPAPYRRAEASSKTIRVLLWVCLGLIGAGLASAGLYLIVRERGLRPRLLKALVVPVSLYFYFRFVGPLSPAAEMLSFSIANTALVEITLLAASPLLCLLFHRLYLKGRSQLWSDCLGIGVSVVALVQVLEIALNGGLLLALDDQTFALRLAAIPPVGFIVYAIYAYSRPAVVRTREAEPATA